MKTSDFDYELPSHLIAQTPQLKREMAKLLVVDRKTDIIEHKVFSDITDYFGPNDIIVLNNTKVDQARIRLVKSKTRSHYNALVVESYPDDCFLILSNNQHKLHIGDSLSIDDNEDTILFEVKEIHKDGFTKLLNKSKLTIDEIKSKFGALPIPPYIKNSKEFSEYYQTVYANEKGSIAAPTAGLHFTIELMDKLKAKGVEILYITLNVGLGTFLPVKTDEILEHKMHKETYSITEEVANKLNEGRKEGKKITAIGTTSVRSLEANFNGKINPGTFSTDIFIYPGYKYQVVDHLVTNFHLPKSTLIMLVSAFYDIDKVKELYRVAVLNGYRFYSFGDAMLIL